MTVGAGQPVRTTCPYCGVGCGILATPKVDGTVDIAGDPDHPANFGRLCSKGSALGETLSLDDRLLYPEVNGKRATWNNALDLVARTFREVVANHGPDSVAFYVSGQILTEDYYVANKLMKGFIGAANIDTNSRLCMASSVAGHRRAFGSDTVPGTYEDLEKADLIVLVGSNLAWCHPVLFQRLEAAKAERPGMRVVVVDPRETATCSLADLHLALKPDTDVALFNGLLAYLSGSKALNRTYIDRYTEGLEAAIEAAGPLDINRVAKSTGLPPQDIALFYAMMARTEKTVTVFSQGVNQSIVGTDKVNAIINIHLATGRIGREGMGPFSVTGQPNAMGGREVGGLANMLAAHMALENPDHRDLVQTFWNSPTIADAPGLKAVDLFKAVGDGRIKALWIMATNPVDSLPEADTVADALSSCPFVVVSDVTRATDTAAFADVLLPSAAWGEKDGTVTNSERRISRQRAFLDLPGEARPDWWQMAEVAARMGFEKEFAYSGPAEIFREHAALSAFRNDGHRDFDIGGLAGLNDRAYDDLAPVTWPVRDNQRSEPRFFGEGGYYTATGRARFVPVRESAARPLGRRYPFVLNTGRIRDQWHTMTRTGKTPRLCGHIAEPFAELHPEDAATLGIDHADLVEVSSPHGAVVVRAQMTERVKKGTVFVPMHWTDQVTAKGRVDAVIGSQTDPVSGQPGSKFTPVAVRKCSYDWYGFAVVREKPLNMPAGYWAIAPTDGGWRMELAGQGRTALDTLAEALMGHSDLDLLRFEDRAEDGLRLAGWSDDSLIGAFFFAGKPVTVSRQWASGLLAQTSYPRSERYRVLAGRPPAATPDKGAIVCSCFQIGARQIDQAMATGARSVRAIGTRLKAGTNCGSCRSEIKARILRHIAEKTDDTDIAKAG